MPLFPLQVGVKVCSQTVSRWAAQVAAVGEQSLKKAGRAGRKPLLNAAEQERLVELLKKGPERLGYQTPRWTCWRVAHLIEQEFGVSYQIFRRSRIRAGGS